MKKVYYVSVVFESSSRNYSYLSLIELNVGEAVVVETRDTISVGKVVKVTDATGNETGLKWVLATANGLKEQMQGAKEHYAKVRALKAELNERMKEFENESMWRLLAEKDKRAAELMAELEALKDGQ